MDALTKTAILNLESRLQAEQTARVDAIADVQAHTNRVQVTLNALQLRVDRQLARISKLETCKV